MKNLKTLDFLLILMALVLACAYIFFSYLLPLTPGRIERESASLISKFVFWSWIESWKHPALYNVVYVAQLLFVFTVTAFSSYGFAIYLSWKRKATIKTLFIAIGATSIFLSITFFSLPNFNTDIFNYIVSARVSTEYNENPYYVPPDQFPKDPIYPYAGHQYTKEPDNKLPTWMLISFITAEIAGDNPTNNLLLFRLTFLLFNIANVALVALICYRLNPQYLLTGIILYGWSPIVVLFAQSKTDTVMVFFLLLTVFSLTRNLKKFAVVALSLSVFVKLITLPLLTVVFLKHITLRNWQQLIVITGIFLAVTFVLYMPFVEEPDLLLDHIAFIKHGGTAMPGIFRSILMLLFILLVFGIGFFQNGTVKQLLHGWVLISLFFSIFIIQNISYSWYLITPIALTALICSWYAVFIIYCLSFLYFFINLVNMASTDRFPIIEAYDISRFRAFLIFIFIMAVSTGGVALWRNRNRAALRKVL